MNYRNRKSYRSGRAACEKAEYMDDYDNPYDSGSEDWILWNNGWNGVAIEDTPNEERDGDSE